MKQKKRTPLYSVYEKLGAKIINFGDWQLPLQFSSIKAEHKATRNKASIFDVSHMGEITIKGKDSLAFLQRITTNDVTMLMPTKVQYSLMCNEKGGIIDDFLVYMLAENEYMLVVNAVNTEKDYQWLLSQRLEHENICIRNESESYALIALQGPKAEDILQRVVNDNIREIKYFSFKQHIQIRELQNKVMISRTGYTGEDGFEIYLAAEDCVTLWNELLTVGKEDGILPAGLGARDTLRFEAGLPLYGQELTEEITPLEAGLKFAVKINESDFIGKEMLVKQIKKGVAKKLVGIEMIEQGIPRPEYLIFSENNKRIGKVTTGTQALTLQKNIGFAYIDSKFAAIGTQVHVQIRDKFLKAKVVKTPFYRR